MKRTIAFGLAAVFALLILVLVTVNQQRVPTTFTIEPGTERTFHAGELIPGDRFSCHGGILPRQEPGYTYDASNGTLSATDTRGNVTVRCPEQLEPV